MAPRPQHTEIPRAAKSVPTCCVKRVLGTTEAKFWVSTRTHQTAPVHPSEDYDTGPCHMLRGVASLDLVIIPDSVDGCRS